MGLRRKLILLQTSVIIILFVIITSLISSLLVKSIPLMEEGIKIKARSCLQSMLPDLDVGIISDDPRLLKRLMKRCDFGKQKDADLIFVAVTDARGRVLASTGHHPPVLPGVSRGGEGSITRLENGFRAHLPVWFEGKYLGDVWTQYSTDRVQRWKQQNLIFSIIALVLILVSGVTSIFFAIHLIKPLRDMISFVHRVAKGDLDSDLPHTRASDELGQLAVDLKKMSVDLKTTQEQLLDASRSVGMAEVATNVLHNVGNVLNSLNVSAHLITDQMRNASSDLLFDVSDLINENIDDLGRFFSESEKGRQLPQFIGALARQLATEKTRAIEEMESLQRNTEHIKAIVSTQQSYSRTVGLEQRVTLEEIVELALQINKGSIERHGISVVRQLVQLPSPILVDKHKLLQIMINLMKNARDSLRESGRADKTMTVSTRLNGDSHISVSVGDNGVGISPEICNQIFEHGFSTKENGRGFGLHSVAITAIELGAAVSCHSDGPGRGATFTLELPYQEEVRQDVG